MDDTFQIRVHDAAVAAWWTLLIACVFFAFQWIIYLGVMATQPPWVVSFWGPGATWESIRTVWFQALVVVYAFFTAGSGYLLLKEKPFGASPAQPAVDHAG